MKIPWCRITSDNPVFESDEPKAAIVVLLKEPEQDIPYFDHVVTHPDDIHEDSLEDMAASIAETAIRSGLEAPPEDWLDRWPGSIAKFSTHDGVLEI